MFTDTHCHLDDDRITDKDAAVERYLRAGVDTVINAGCDYQTSLNGLELSAKYESVFFAAGYHPSEVGSFDGDAAEKIFALAREPKCVAIGEIGLDYHWQGFDKEKQKRAFVTQLDAAYSLKLPVSLHVRDATEDCLKILKENSSKLRYGGTMHCFSGSKETAREVMNLGLCISFGGTLTFKNASNVVQVALYTPNEFCLTETDSPYLSPHPYRGGVNEPSLVPLVAAKLAEIKGIELDSLAEILHDNTERVFYKIKECRVQQKRKK